MGSGHAHDHTTHANERSLWIALAFTGTFLITEIIGGILTGSLALLSDAAHMLTDTAALAIALAAIRIGRRPADAQRTFGYQRFEILAAAVNAVLLFFVALYIFYEGYQRLANLQEIKSLGMLIVATIGLVVNFISMSLLSAGKDRSLNVKGAYLEVWSDLLGSIGVIVAAVVIHFSGWLWVDPLIAIAIGIWVLPRSWILLKDSTNILLEGVPRGIDLTAITAAIRSVPGVRDVHDLHVWAITSESVSLSAHVAINEALHADRDIVRAIRAMLIERFGIHHSTIQCGDESCAILDKAH